MNQSVLTIRFDKSHLAAIGSRLYAESLDLVRELVANAYDADATKVHIQINDNTLTVEDDGAGMDRSGLEQYFTIGSSYKKENPTTPLFKRVRIGEFGIGKFAVLSLCDRFELYTVAKTGYSATVIFDRHDFENRDNWEVPIVEHAVKKSSTTQTRVTLFALKKPLETGDLERHLIHIFPLDDHNFSLFINGVKLQPRYIAGQRFKINEKTEFGPIKGEILLSSLILSSDLKGIAIRVKGVLIKRDSFTLESRHTAASNRFTGDITADFLPITSSRSDFIKDTPEFKTFYQIINKKLKRVIRQIDKSAISYADKKAEKTLSDALTMIKHALKKNSDIFFPGEIPLFNSTKSKKFETNLADTIIGKSLGQKKLGNSEKNLTDDVEKIVKQAISKLRPKVRRPVKTLLRDEHRVVKKVRIGGSDFLVSFAHLGPEEKESFTEGGIIFINRDHELFRKVAKKTELVFYHLIRLVSQELIKLTLPKNIELAYNWQGRLITDAFLKVKEVEKNEKQTLMIPNEKREQLKI